MASLRICYQTIEIENIDIHVRTLRDKQQFSDVGERALKVGISSAMWPIFGVIWESGEVLARLMFDYEVEGKRILEVGCGIGLASLVLNTRLADITATDYHPEAELFLQINVELNNGADIPFVRTAWEDDVSSLGCFDLIIGSDLLYERDCVNSLSDFIDQHSKAQCHVIIVDPGRGQSSHFTKRMHSYGYSKGSGEFFHGDIQKNPFKGKILHYER